MTTTFEPVTIAGQTYNSFATIAYANTYLAADPVNAATWQALSGDQPAQYLVSATRLLLRQPWPMGVLDDPVPQQIVDATVELAVAMAGGYDAVNQATTASLVKSQQAGSVRQEFFAPTMLGATSGHRFPLPVWELISGFLGGDSSGIGGSLATGTCGYSISENDYGFNLSGTGSSGNAFDRDWE